MFMILRSVLFDLSFYIFSFLYLGAGIPFLLILPRSYGQKLFYGWSKGTVALLRFFVNLSYRIEGKENLEEALKNGPCIIACKHQSVWETLVFALLLDDFQTVIKRQLTKIPIFNVYLKKLNAIVVDRDAGAQAIKQLVQGGRDAIKHGRSIIIFPEGTRSSPDTPGAYQPGIAALYRDLNVPVLPVAVNSGVFWGRRSPIKKPGCIVLKFLPPLPANMPKGDFLEHLEQSIETGCKSLVNKSPKVSFKRDIIFVLLSCLVLWGGLIAYSYHQLHQFIQRHEITYEKSSWSLSHLGLPCYDFYNLQHKGPDHHLKLSSLKLMPLPLFSLSIKGYKADFTYKLANIEIDTIESKVNYCFGDFSSKNITINNTTFSAFIPFLKLALIKGDFTYSKEQTLKFNVHSENSPHLTLKADLHPTQYSWEGRLEIGVKELDKLLTTLEQGQIMSSDEISTLKMASPLFSKDKDGNIFFGFIVSQDGIYPERPIRIQPVF